MNLETFQATVKILLTSISSHQCETMNGSCASLRQSSLKDGLFYVSMEAWSGQLEF